jgi:choice-of-anchor C domain-containing protein
MSSRKTFPNISAVIGLLVLTANIFGAPFANGSFESASVNPGGGFVLGMGVGDSRIDSWIVSAGDIDYIGGYWKASNGSRSLDLSGWQAGAISQTFDTDIGQRYEVKFDLSGEPNSTPPLTKTIRVSVPGSFSVFTFDARQNPSRSNMKWEEHSFTFTATDKTTTLTFTSMDQNNAGPALDNVRVSAGACQIPNVPLFKQSGPLAPWSFDHYDNRCAASTPCSANSPKFDCALSSSGASCLIGYLGCHLTSAAMLLSHHGVSVTPDQLNSWFSQRIPGPLGCASCYVGYSHGDLKPGAIAAYAQSRGVVLTELGWGRASQLSEKICSLGPQIIRIIGGQHWMVVTGSKNAAADTFLVNDPAANSAHGGNRTKWPLNGISAIRLFSGPNSPSVNPAAIVIRVYSPAELILTNPDGLRIGNDPRTGESFSEIIDATYNALGIDDDFGNLDLDPPKELDIRQPSAGDFKLHVIGTGNSTYDLDMYFINSFGNREEIALEKVPISIGETHEYKLAYSNELLPNLIVRVDPSRIWPPNNKLITIKPLVLVPGYLDKPVSEIKLNSISCDDNCDESQDISGANFGTDDREFQLRASRSGSGIGRTYSITYSASIAGKTSFVTTSVFVPHHNGLKNK